jgi:hypothetical protein
LTLCCTHVFALFMVDRTSMAMRGDSTESVLVASGTIYNEIWIWKLEDGIPFISLKGHDVNISMLFPSSTIVNPHSWAVLLTVITIISRE